MNISSNISSIQSHQMMMGVSANNVANVNTDGFVPSSTKISGGENFVNATIRKADNDGSLKSQTDLAKEIPDQIVAKEATGLNVTAIKTQDEIFRSLLDIKA